MKQERQTWMLRKKNCRATLQKEHFEKNRKNLKK